MKSAFTILFHTNIFFFLSEKYRMKKLTIKIACITNSPPRKGKLLLHYHCCYYSCIFLSMMIYEYFCAIFKKMNSSFANIFSKSAFKWFQWLSSKNCYFPMRLSLGSNNYKSITIKAFYHFGPPLPHPWGSQRIFPYVQQASCSSLLSSLSGCAYLNYYWTCVANSCEKNCINSCINVLSIATALWGQ